MSYDTLPAYWMIPRRLFQEHDGLVELVWPQGLPEDEYIGEFYHVSQGHENAAFIALIAGHCETRRINRTEVTFPRWLKSRAGVGPSQ